MASFGKHFKIDQNLGLSNSDAIKKGKTYRITVLSERLVRLEYAKDGKFNDSLTDLVQNRKFKTPNFKVEEDDRYLIITTKYFSLQYVKERPFKGPIYAPDANLKVKLLGTEKFWYYDHPEVRNFGSSSFSLDDFKGNNKLNKGLYSVDGFVSINDNHPLLIDNIGIINNTDDEYIDTYLFMYKRDFGLCLKDYFTLTGYPTLIPRYALGIWWYRDKIYSESDVYDLIDSFNQHEIPLSVLLLGEFWHTKDPHNYNLYKSGYSFNKNLFPKPEEFIESIHDKGVKLGINIDPVEGITPKDEVYEECAKELEYTDGKPIPFNAFDKMFIVTYFEDIINPLTKMNVDFFWIDYKDNLKFLRALDYYHIKDFKQSDYKRPMLLTRNTGISAHRNGVLYSGETIVSWNTLKYLPFFNCSASNIGLSWWSHDIGGFKDGIEDAELYTRYCQFATFNPIFRLSAKRGVYYKREPWLWDYKTYNIVKSYTSLRMKLIPYIYSYAYTYSSTGIPLVQPLYYGYPEIYDEPDYKTEYYFGNELFVSPIIAPEDPVMDRAIKRLFLPKGTWYEFISGKKYSGGKRYVAFYKDEDYPVFAKAGAIIPMNHKDSDIEIPTSLDVQVFPGKSNTFKLYEDDGITSLYEQGYYHITSFEYVYDSGGYSLQISPLKGKNAVIPDKRTFTIIFRNMKMPSDFSVQVNGKNYDNYILSEKDNNLIIKIPEADTSKNILIRCLGEKMELDAQHILNEDIDSIINDLKIQTNLKEKIARIAFSDLPVNKKRIAIRKLERQGLDHKFVLVFLKLYDYLAEI